MFADLVGFTPFSEERDPEAVREVLGGYFEVARERIERYGGTVEKFIGDAVMAVWGTPVAHEDDPERAVRAALELIDAVAGLRATGDGSLAARAAVLTGEAAVDPSAVGQGFVTGDLVNTASRLQSVAPSGTVLVDEATVRAAGQAIVFEAAGEQILKGKTAPVTAWTALRVVGGIGGARRAARLEPPFVGRDDELRMLKDLYHATAREGRARLVSVIGIAGIGKSRLAWEFFKYIDGLVETVYWHQGRSPAYGDGLAFWALGEMVRQRAGLLEGDDPATSSSKLAAMLAEYVPEEADRTMIGPRLAGLLGIADMPPGGPEEVYAAWRTLFERIAERGPTVLVFEDLHWAEQGLLEFIEELVASSRHRPILVITLGRPELLERRPTWGAGVRRLTTIDLGPLASEAMDMLLLGLVPGIPPEAIRVIRERSEGVPLYAVETVRMLLDQGSLTEHEGRYRLAGDLPRLAVPESLTGLLGARIDTLSEREREVLGHAAVLGQTFHGQTLATLSGIRDDEVRMVVDELVGREIIEIDDDPRSPTRGQHRFVQGLMREVVYSRLSRRERMARHLAAAEHFESLDSDELSGVIASHYLEAYRAAPEADTAPLAARARAALVAAADRAAALGATDRAVDYLIDAENLAADEEERLGLAEAVLRMGARAARNSLVVDRAQILYADSRRRGDREGAARAAMWHGLALINDGRPGEARQVLLTAYEEAGGTVDSAATARLAAELVRSHLMNADPGAALPLIEVALPIAERLDLRGVIAELLPSKGWALAEHGRRHEAAALLAGAVDFAEELGNFNAEGRARMNQSAWLATEDPRRAFESARDGFERAMLLGYREWAGSLFSNAASIALELGEWSWIDDAIERLDPEFHIGGWLGLYLTIRSTLAAYRGDAEAATRELERFRDDLRDRPDPQLRSTLEYADGLRYLAAGELSEAFEAAGRAAEITIGDQAADAVILGGRAAAWAGDLPGVQEMLELAGATVASNGRLFRAKHQALEGSASALSGDREAAATLYARAIVTLAQLGADFERALVLLDTVQLLPDDPHAAQAAADARAVFERLGARPFLARLDTAIGSGMFDHSVTPDMAGALHGDQTPTTAIDL
jgi:class 3 adenylate cyclase